MRPCQSTTCFFPFTEIRPETVISLATFAPLVCHDPNVKKMFSPTIQKLWVLQSTKRIMKHYKWRSDQMRQHGTRII
jgi:hypothetical protein